MTASAIEGIDHIMVRVEKAEPIMDLFVNVLGLPVSWPLQRSDFATYGWVTAGNTNLEFWAAANNGDLPENQALPCFHGFALTPADIHKSVALLAGRGISTKTPRPYITKMSDGRSVTNFTNAVINDLSSSACCIFLCEWGDEGTIFPWSGKLSSAERQKREREQLEAVNGGPLGITRLAEVRIATPDIAGYKAKWRHATGRTGPVELGDGIALSVVQGECTAVKSIVFGVRSLERAHKFLSDNHLLGESPDGELALSSAACAPLMFCFRQDALA